MRDRSEIIVVEGLSTYFPINGSIVKAVDGISFVLLSGESLAIIGENGSGKTVTALSIIKLVPHPGNIVGGSVIYKGRDLVSSSENYMSRIRGSEISMVFQSPGSTLCPIVPVRTHLHTIVRKAFPSIGRKERREKVRKSIELVGFEDEPHILSMYPFELSGGMAQRVQIAMAIASEPRILIVDEPTSDLDVISQVHILKLLRRLKQQLDLSMIIITHNISFVSTLCESMVVLKKGMIVEKGSTRNLLKAPKQDYTRSLLSAAKYFSLDYHDSKAQ